MTSLCGGGSHRIVVERLHCCWPVRYSIMNGVRRNTDENFRFEIDFQEISAFDVNDSILYHLLLVLLSLLFLRVSYLSWEDVSWIDIGYYPIINCSINQIPSHEYSYNIYSWMSFLTRCLCFRWMQICRIGQMSNQLVGHDSGNDFGIP